METENTALEADAQGAPEAPSSIPERDYEKEARESGWVPEAEFKGDNKPEKFLDAETFVKRGEAITPFIRKENKRLKDELAKEKLEYAKRFERLEKTSKIAFEAAERQFKTDLDRVKREQRSAVEAGDMKEYDRLETVKGNLEKAAPKLDEPVDPAADLTTRQDAWKRANPWFESDFEVQDWAIRFSDFNGRKNPDLSFEDNMAVVAAEARKKFPKLFGESAANGHAAVDGGGSFPGASRKQGKTYADLPPEAKAACDRFVNTKVMTKEKYVKDYFND
jgi:hypothetical protein